MRKIILLWGLAGALLLIVACGGGDGHDNPPPQVIVTQILSDPVYDGDITENPLTGAFTVRQGNTESIFAGIDPFTQEESRAFLDFPLTGADGVPGDAIIQEATLDIFITGILPQPLPGTLSVRIDLVSFQPPLLINTDYDLTIQPALATTNIIPPILQSDLSNHVPVDVTSLMKEAQRLGLADFQLRILLDLGAVSPGLIEINDTTGNNRSLIAPLLEVRYL